MLNQLIAMVGATMSDRKAVTALEYGVIAAATIVVGLAAFGAIGTDLSTVFTNVKTSLTAGG